MSNSTDSSCPSCHRGHRGRSPVRWALLAVISLTLGSALLAQTPQQPTFRSGVELVQVDVVVVDKDGKHVRGLKAADFAVLDRDKPQTIATFEEVSHERPREAAPAPLLTRPARLDVGNNQTARSDRLVVMVIDDLHIYKGRTERAQDIARQIVSQLGPQASMAVLFTSANRNTQVTEDRAELLAAIDTLRGRQSVRRPHQARDDQTTPAGDPEQDALARLDADRQGAGGQRPAVLRQHDAVQDARGRRAHSRCGRCEAKGVRAGVGGDRQGSDWRVRSRADAVRSQVPLLPLLSRSCARRDDGVAAALERDDLRHRSARARVAARPGARSGSGSPGTRRRSSDRRVQMEQPDSSGPGRPDDHGRGHRRVRGNRYGRLHVGPRSHHRGSRSLLSARLLSERSGPDDRIPGGSGARRRIGQRLPAARGEGPRPSGLDCSLPQGLPAWRRAAAAGEQGSRWWRWRRASCRKPDLPLRLYATVFPGERKLATVAAAIEITAPTKELLGPDAKLHDQVSYGVLVVDEKKTKVTSRTNLAARIALKPRVAAPSPEDDPNMPSLVSYQIPLTLELAPGKYQLRASATSTKLGKGGSVYLTIEVPDFAKEALSHRRHHARLCRRRARAGGRPAEAGAAARCPGAVCPVARSRVHAGRHAAALLRGRAQESGRDGADQGRDSRRAG